MSDRHDSVPVKPDEHRIAAEATPCPTPAAPGQFRIRAAGEALESRMGYRPPLLGSLVNDGRRRLERLLVALELVLRKFLHDEQLVRRLVFQPSEAF